MLCVDGNARPPPFISEPPRAGAVNLLSQGRGLPVTKPLEVWGVQALRPAHCPGQAGRQRGGRPQTPALLRCYFWRGLNAGSVTLPSPDLEKGLPSSLTRQPAGSRYPSGGAPLCGNPSLPPKLQVLAWAFFTSAPALRGCLGHLCPGTPVPFQTGISTAFRQCFQWVLALCVML